MNKAGQKTCIPLRPLPTGRQDCGQTAVFRQQFVNPRIHVATRHVLEQKQLQYGLIRLSGGISVEEPPFQAIPVFAVVRLGHKVSLGGKGMSRWQMSWRIARARPGCYRLIPRPVRLFLPEMLKDPKKH